MGEDRRWIPAPAGVVLQYTEAILTHGAMYVQGGETLVQGTAHAIAECCCEDPMWPEICRYMKGEAADRYGGDTGEWLYELLESTIADALNELGVPFTR